MDSQASRAAKNEALFREVNERIVELTETFEAEGLEIICECSDTGCGDTFRVTTTEYDSIRAAGNRFAVISGHEDASVEHPVDRNERFTVVEKIGESGAVARALDAHTD